MKLLKKAREQKGFTQSQLGKVLGTTQQTIARWEAGKVEPNIASLRDLAICLDTSVDYLLGKEPVLAYQNTDPFSWIKGDKSGYWGNIGIRPPNHEYSIWYPVTTLTMESVYEEIQSISNSSFIPFQTLNNKMVVFCPSRIESLIFLDEADDQVIGDWRVSPADIEGWPEEIYECLQHLLWNIEGDIDDNEEFSEKLVSVSKNLITEHKLTQEDLIRMCLHTRIIHTSGKNKYLDVASMKMADALFHFEQENIDFLMLPLGNEERNIFLSLNLIALIEFPLTIMKQGLQEILAGDTSFR